MQKTYQEVINGKWQLSMVDGICIGIEVPIMEGYSRVLLNTILPDTDKDYKNEKKEIEGLMQYICDLHNNKKSEESGSSVRPIVKWFAEQMEAALKRNDHKGGWLGDTWDELYDRLKDESKELKKECQNYLSDNEDKIIKEAADVANFAMMIADIFGKEIGQFPPPLLPEVMN